MRNPQYLYKERYIRENIFTDIYRQILYSDVL